MTSGIDLVCLGRAGVDVCCLPDGGEEHQLGGVAARTSRLGRRSNRPPQQFRPASAMTMRVVVHRAFEHTGVDITAVQVDAEYETTRLRIDVRAGTRPLAVANEAAADLFLRPGHIDRELIAGARLLQIIGTVLAAAEHAAKNSAPVGSPSSFVPVVGRTGPKPWPAWSRRSRRAARPSSEQKTTSRSRPTCHPTPPPKPCGAGGRTK